MDARDIGVYFLVFLVFCFQCICCIRLGNEEELLLRRVLQEFETAPEDGRFDRTIEIHYKDAKLFPKILIWCPIRHNGLTIKCPVHNCPLRVGKWTDVLYGARADPRNPRLVYDLHGNLVLVQVSVQRTITRTREKRSPVSIRIQRNFATFALQCCKYVPSHNAAAMCFYHALV